MAGNENSGDHKDFATAEDLMKAFEEYLEWLKENKVNLDQASAGKVVTLEANRIPTIKGFWVMYLKRSWANWQDYLKTPGYQNYFEVSKKIQDYCEASMENALVNGEGNTTGIIFNLKNNYGWNQEEKRDHTGLPQLTITHVNKD